MIKKKMRFSFFPCEDAAAACQRSFSKLHGSPHTWKETGVPLKGRLGFLLSAFTKNKLDILLSTFTKNFQKKLKLFLAMRQHALTQSHSPWPKCLGGSLAIYF
jgi:hypothetical protein